LVFFVFLLTFYFSSVNLGSGVTIEVETAPKRVILMNRNPKEKDKDGKECNRYPKKPSPVSVTEVDGIEYKVEREVIRYERLEEVMDDLPEFVQEILESRLDS
jgi:hypothetical protein